MGKIYLFSLYIQDNVLGLKEFKFPSLWPVSHYSLLAVYGELCNSRCSKKKEIKGENSLGKNKLN